MRKWNFTNGVEVFETEYDGELHAFQCFNGKVLGFIYPSDIDSMESMIKDLDNGEDPISGCWEDGMGNTCTLDGWGNETNLFNNKWEFPSGVEVFEKEPYTDCIIFECRYDGDILGTIYPDNLKDAEKIVVKLDNGEDPITNKWYAGKECYCTFDGWGEN